MNTLEKTIIAVGVVLVVGFAFLIVQNRDLPVGAITGNQYQSASSTRITTGLNGAMLLSTSSLRTAFTVTPINCANGGDVLYLDLGVLDGGTTTAVDAPHGFPVTSSTTAQFSEGTIHTITDTISGITRFGNCSVLVNEWRAVR